MLLSRFSCSLGLGGECVYTMQAEKNNLKRVFYHSAIDWKDDIEEKLERARLVLSRLTGNVSEREAHDILTSASCRDQKTHDDICLGLLATILTDQPLAVKCFRDLNFLSRDSLGIVIDQLVFIAIDKYQKLTDTSRNQFLWIVSELVRAGVNNVDLLCWNLMRQIAGGDISNRNLWLAERMVDIYSENRSWLEKYPILIATVIYTYLRILEDHTATHLASLKQKEVNFLVGLIRAHFTDVCMNQQIGLGRDFLRLLQSVSRIPEIESLWKDIYGNPNSLDAHLTGVHQLLNCRTSRKYLQSRLTPDMEKKIIFLTSNVRFGMQKRYQEWFQRQYLSTPESQTLRADIIRFIVGVIHPTNEILCSDILPRWAVIGWLLTTCTHPVAAANAKLALFFDWLVFDPVKDNIMNIEPAILVMFHSLRPHPSITATLLDFLIRLTIEYWPAGVDKIKDGIGSALRTIVEKKVLASLDLLLENPKLDSDLRFAIQEHLIVLLERKETSKNQTPSKIVTTTSPFVECNNINLINYSGNGNGDKDPAVLTLLDIPNPSSMSINSFGGGGGSGGSLSPPLTLSTPSSLMTMSAAASPSNNNNSSSGDGSSGSNHETSTGYHQADPEFSPEEDEEEGEGDVEEPEDEEDVKEINHVSTALAGALPTRNSPTLAASVEEAEKSKIFEVVLGLSSELRLPLEKMLNESESDWDEYLDDVIEDVSDRSIDANERHSVAKCLLYIYRAELSSSCIQKDSIYLIENLTTSPLQEILTQILELKITDKTPKRKNLMKLLADLVNFMPQVGYKLLILLEQMSRAKKPSKNQDHYPLLYKNLCTYRSLKLEAALFQDLKNCWEFEPNVVGFLCPILYEWYDQETMGSAEMLRTVVSALDPYQLQENMWKIMQGDFQIVDDNTLVPVLTKTFDWETWEQHCVWTMLSAHGFKVEEYLPLIPQLDAKNNAEALTYLMMILKSEKPTGEILAPLLSRKPNIKDRFVISLLLNWSETDEDEDLLAETLATVLVRASGSPVKRKRGATGGRGTASPAGPATPTVENVLAHLDHLRICLNWKDEDYSGVFSKDPMQAALLQVQSWVTETQKSKYKDLLELAAEEPDAKETTSSSRGGSKRNSSTRKLPSSPTPSQTNPSSSLSRTRSGKTRPPVKDGSDDSSDEDEEVVRPRNAKKRKKPPVSSSDSD